MDNIVRETVSNILNRSLTKKESLIVKQRITQDLQNPSQNQQNSEKVLWLSAKLAEQFTQDSYNPDIHEILLNEIDKPGDNSENRSLALLPSNENNNMEANKFVNVDKLLSIRSIYDAVSLFNPKALTRKAFLAVDSRFVSLEENNKLIWYFNDNLNIIQGGINYPAKIRNIISMKLDNLLFYTGRTDFVTSSNRISVLIEEFAAQSFLSPSGRRYHFLGIPVSQSLSSNTYNGIKFTMEEPMNFGEFHFRKPFTVIDKLSLTFGTPNTLINLSQDAIYGNCVVTVTGSWQVNVDLGQPHGITIGNRTNVLITNFTTSQSAIDALWIGQVTSINNVGLSVSANVLQVNFEAGGAPGTPAGTPSNCTLRIILDGVVVTADLELTYLESSTDIN